VDSTQVTNIHNKTTSQSNDIVLYKLMLTLQDDHMPRWYWSKCVWFVL